MTAGSRVAAAALGCVLAGHAAHAQPPDADALFREGRRLIKQGDIKAGCEKLDASERIESSIGTLLNLGDCREKLGKPVGALTAFRKAEALARLAGNDAKREQEARRRARALEAELASITVQVGPKAQTDGIVITRDGDVIAPDQWGSTIFVEPGAHTVVAEARGFQRWQLDVTLGKGSNRWVSIPSLEPLVEEPTTDIEPPAAATPPPTAATPPPPKREESPPPVAPTPRPSGHEVTTHTTWSTQRGIAVAVGALGVSAIVVGGIFGSQAGDLQSKSDAICPTNICDDAEGLRLNNDAHAHARIANVLFATGGLAVATGVVLWIVGKPDETTVITPVISDTHVGASFARRF